MEEQIKKLRFLLKIHGYNQEQAKKHYDCSPADMQRIVNPRLYKLFKQKNRLNNLIQLIIDDLENKTVKADKKNFCLALKYALHITSKKLSTVVKVNNVQVIRNNLSGKNKSGLNKIYQYILNRKDAKLLLSTLSIDVPS